MSTPTSSRNSDSDRYGHWGDDRLYGEDRLDDWSATSGGGRRAPEPA